ncbi:enolase C-terminal domain-like protein [Chelativorans sp. Marseille-P2723]|uniref:mandelate racemase/muconate lactonizing enzyme family protein n=1 Tax=Chelativorans sp. Marseille-P2723 TaxID=2709133 RepID=UPI00156E20F4|nr:enolase C-terminal domain-like protein [Chelativorans sp. Marseille-P2723]
MIDRIEVFVTELPTRIQRTFSSGSYDTGAPQDLLGKPVLVAIHGGGAVGYGQIRPISPGHFVADTVHSVVAAITEIYGPLLLGRHPSEFEAVQAAFDDRLAGNPAARAVLDSALHDLWGKQLGVPVARLLGGVSQPVIPIEWSVSMAADQGKMLAEAERAVHQFGIRVLCLKAAGKGGWRQDVRNLEMVRKALGPDIVIGVDPNTGWTLAETLAFLAAVRDFDLGYLEQPVERRDLRALATIRAQAGGVPVMADESLFTLADAFALAEARAVDVFCIKHYKVGGLSAARKIAAVAEAANIKLNLGGLAVTSQLEAAASAHFHAAFPDRRMFGAAEFAFALDTVGPDPLLTEPALVLKHGAVKLPEAPGLGVAVDAKALDRHTIHRAVVTP